MKIKKVCVSAPSKIILHGEHAAVYGKLVLACSLNKYTYIKIVRNNEDIINLQFKKLGFSYAFSLEKLSKQNFTYDDESFNYEFDKKKFQLFNGNNSQNIKEFPPLIMLSIRAFVYLYYFIVIKSDTNFQCENQRNTSGFIVSIESQIPIGMGLGSSASYCVSLATSFLMVIGKIPYKSNDFNKTHLELINKWSFLAETIIHGKPSGIDNSVCTYGGIVSLNNGSLKKLKFSDILLQDKLKVICIDSKVNRSTKDQIKIVSQLKSKFPLVVEPLLDAIEQIGKEFINTLSLIDAEDDIENRQLLEIPTSNFDFDNLSSLMNVNHDILNALGVGHPELEKIRDLVINFSSNYVFNNQKLSRYILKPKMTGAGGGGYVIALLPILTDATEDLEYEGMLLELQKELKNLGYESFITGICGTGVKSYIDEE